VGLIEGLGALVITESGYR